MNDNSMSAWGWILGVFLMLALLVGCNESTSSLPPESINRSVVPEYVPFEQWPIDSNGMRVMPLRHRLYEERVFRNRLDIRKELKRTDRLLEQTRDLLRRTDID